MFAYCINNPIMLSDYNGAWSLSSIFTAVAVAAATVAVAALCVATCGAAIPAVATATGTIISGATIAATASTVATGAAAVAGVATVAAVETKKREKSYTIYTLSDPDTKEVLYVGRTSDYYRRISAHRLNPNRRDLEPAVLESGLTYEQARVAEQAYILHYHTINRANKAQNQINGINPKRNDYKGRMSKGYGISEYVDNILTNDILCLFE